MGNITAFVWTVLGSAGITTSLLVALAFLCRTWIGERIKTSIKFDYDKKLAELSAELEHRNQAHLGSLRAEIDRQAEKLRISAASFSEVQKATIVRKIEAVDVLWSTVVKTRDAFPGAASLTDILTDAEMATIYTDRSLAKFADDLKGLDRSIWMDVGFKEVQAVRPHLGEYTWAIYVTYRSILVRSLYLIGEGRSTPKVVSWYLDANILAFVASAFGEEKMNEFRDLGNSRYQWLSYQFDTLLFQAIDTLLTGKSFSQAALAQAYEMERQIAADVGPTA